MPDNTTNRQEWQNPDYTIPFVTNTLENATAYYNKYSQNGQLDPYAVIGGLLDGTSPTGPTGPSGSGPRTTTQSNVTISNLTVGASNALLNQVLLQGIGRKATKAELSEFYKGLKAFLKTEASRTTTTTKSSTKSSKSKTKTTQGADASVFAAQFMGSIVAKTLKANPNAEIGGEVGMAMTQLNDYASQMGVFKSKNEINNGAIKIATKSANFEDVKTQYRKDAIALYANFADRLKQDSSLTVRDLVNPYLQMMGDTFEQDANNIKLTDATIQNAINGSKLMSLSDFRGLLRKDARFDVTSTAKREAASIGSAMLRSFGFGA